MLTIGDWFLVALLAVLGFVGIYFVTMDASIAIFGALGGLIGGVVRAYLARRSFSR